MADKHDMVIITDVDTITLLTLNDATALKQDNPLAITEDFRMLKMEIAATLTGGTAGEGPLNLYIVDDELTVAEIAEAINAQGPLDRNDNLSKERAKRPVFLIGTFINSGANEPIIGKDGQEGVLQVKQRWTYANPEGWAIAIHNESGGNLATGGVVRMSMKFFGLWVI